MAPSTESRVLHAPMKVEFDYTRSLGSVLSQFMSALKQHSVLGGVLADGRVVVPPPEYDPVTHEAITELVPVSDFGTVQSWSWVSEPVAQQPLEKPFAFAQILLDGSDAPMLHAVDVDSPADISTGLRVRVRWAEQTTGTIRDIACFEPAGDDVSEGSASMDFGAPEVTGIVSPVNLAYDYAASPEETKFFQGLAEGKLYGQRCPVCEKVYVPPRGACPVDGVPTTDEVLLPDRGTLTTYCVVNVPFVGQTIPIPYVSAYVLLDGADIAFLHLILDVDAADVRMGMRVEAVWKPQEEWTTDLNNIKYFRPTGEPDAEYDTYKMHL
ncbi:MAG: OB-fold domain-containing protein [Propionibacteriales bacterium]|nr:OB-fold domain-containing protein [Propionibacteriales bacterium]